MTTLDSADRLAKTLKGTIQALGPVTVGFFALLIFLLFFMYQYAEMASESHHILIEQQNRLETKIDNAVLLAEKRGILDQYYLRQICANTADTESQRSSCNPLPGVSTVIEDRIALSLPPGFVIHSSNEK